jgi:hypothetical protein
VTAEVYAGSTVTLDATFYDVPGGSLVDPTSVSLSVLDSLGATAFGPYTYAGGTVTKVATGFYRKALTVPAGTTVGAYAVQWTAVIDGDTRVGEETLTVLSAEAAAPTASTDRPWYCTREDVAAALDTASTSRTNRQIDRAIEAASRSIEALCQRTFYPTYATRTFDWPPPQTSQSWRLWFDANELISVTTFTDAGTTITSTDYLLRPDTGPPFTHIEIDISSASAFATGDTHQRSISITGWWGNGDDQTLAGETVEALDTTETGVDVSDSSTVGVGSILIIDDERMIVTGRTQLATAYTLQTAMTAAASGTTVAVTDGTAFHVGETLLLDSEKMLVLDIAGNNLLVKRAWDGTVLATHTGSTIYAPRSLTVRRAALGTTTATHTSGADVYVHQVPADVRALAVAEALTMVAQEQVGYARVAGSGDNQREVSGKGLADLRKQVLTRHGRQARIRAV